NKAHGQSGQDPQLSRQGPPEEFHQTGLALIEDKSSYPNESGEHQTQYDIGPPRQLGLLFDCLLKGVQGPRIVQIFDELVRGPVNTGKVLLLFESWQHGVADNTGSHRIGDLVLQAIAYLDTDLSVGLGE